MWARDRIWRRLPSKKKCAGQTLVVVNQYATPTFQAFVDRLARRWQGPTMLLTGSDGVVGSRYVHIRLKSYDRTTGRSRLTSWMRFSFQLTVWLVRFGRPAVTLAYTNPPLAPLLCGLATRGRGLIVILYDLYPDHLVEQGTIKSRGLVDRVWGATNRYVFSVAQLVAVLGHAMAEKVRPRMPPGNRLATIPIWVDLQEFSPISRGDSRFAAANVARGVVSVLYSGNMGASHGLSLLPEIASQCKDLNVEFILIGQGVVRATLEHEVETRGLANVSFFEPRRWGSVPDALAAGDVILVSQAPGTEKSSLPSKVYFAMAMARPILAVTSNDSDLAQVVTDAECGLVASNRNAVEVALAIRDLARSPALRRSLGEKGRAYVQRHHDIESVAESYSWIINSIGRGSTPRIQ